MCKESESLAVFMHVKIPNLRIFRGLRPLDPHQGSALDLLGGFQRPPDPQLLAAMTFGHCILCLRHNRDTGHFQIPGGGMNFWVIL